MLEVRAAKTAKLQYACTRGKKTGSGGVVPLIHEHKISHEELLNDQIAGLSPAKRALLELKLKQSVRESAGRAVIPRRTHHSPVSLSFAQQRMWFLTQLDPDSPAYNIPVAHRLTGNLDVAALESAFKEIVRRHESLRTRFEGVAGVPQ